MHPKTRERNDKLGDETSNIAIFAAARESAKKTARGLTALFAAIDAVEAVTKLPFDEGVQVERKPFEQWLFSDQAKALIHVFFAEREVAKLPGLSLDTKSLAINQAAIIGAGTMGGGIAMNFAHGGGRRTAERNHARGFGSWAGYDHEELCQHGQERALE